jgi:hypothetical protein
MILYDSRGPSDKWKGLRVFEIPIIQRVQKVAFTPNMFCFIVATKPFSLMHVQSLTFGLSPTLTMMSLAS